MEFDFSKLVGRIIEKFGTRSAFATAYGVTESYLSYRVNNKTPFSLPDIYRMCLPEFLDIAPEEIPSYFFNPKVR